MHISILRKLFLLLSIFITLSSFAGKEQWTDYFSYFNTRDIVQVGQELYIVSENGILCYNLDDKTIRKISKANLLSDIGLSAIGANSDGDIVIGYINGNIDILTGNDVYNIPDLKNKVIYGSKSINEIIFYNDICYIATSFGILAFDITKKEFIDTYYIGDNGDALSVYDLITDSRSDKLYAATAKGIYSTTLDDRNLADFRNWNKDTAFPGNDSVTHSFCMFNNKIYAATKDTSSRIYVKDQDTWSLFYQDTNLISSIYSNNKYLAITEPKKITILKENLLPQTIIENDPKELHYYNGVFFDSNDRLWLLDKTSGLLDSDKEPLFDNCISKNFISDLAIDDRGIWVSQGLKNQYSDGFISLIDINTTYNAHNMDLRDIMCMAISERLDKIYYGTWGFGLVETHSIHEAPFHYTDKNSPLQEKTGQICVPDIAFDKNDNLWIINWYVNNPLSVKTPEGEWTDYYFQGFTNKNTWVNTLCINSHNQKWVGTYSSSAPIFVFDENKTIDDTSDDYSRILQLKDSDGQIFAENVYAIVEDKEGVMWIGTNKGVATYSSPQSVFSDESPSFNRTKLEEDGFVDFLLAGNTISAIAIDGGNRKWIGTTTSGIFLISASGDEQIYNFTTENSPLPSNSITSILVKGENGEVFIGTDKGLVSFAGDGTAPYANYDDVKIYPNPIRENYFGNITIDGLVEDSDIKITDMSGNLVFTTKSNGGRAIWNGKNLKGQRVNTGVYLVFLTNPDGSQTQVSKLLFIN